ncbi:hypothetical protein [Bacillus sp. AFS017336]|uniref:hypothetical protein n=1 Tax=Bacillus sp. AFS017336 TaxID=2033489 RepID=UPI000BEFF604|nr:hypothetical protein [Bacillus sp. AFS017336]PEL12651.1 hypothetical protein CN601_06805 [Bacillus sp. AFS017336]
MTSLKQNFSMYAGDSKEIVVSVVDENGVALPLSGATVKWILMNNSSSITKNTTNGITLSGSDIHIKLDPADTLTLTGLYEHEIELTDSLGNVSTVTKGTVNIIKSLI